MMWRATSTIARMLLVIFLTSGMVMAQNMTYRNIKLGITLEEFRKIPPSSVLRTEIQDSKVMCTHEDQVTDSIVRLALMPKKYENELNIINCVFVNDTGMPGRTQDISEISVGDYGTNKYLFKFAKKDGAKSYVLHRMELFFFAGAYSDAEKSLTNRYGKPKDDQLMKTWRTSTSQAILVDMSKINNLATINYILTDMEAYLAAKKKKLENMESGKF